MVVRRALIGAGILLAMAAGAVAQTNGGGSSGPISPRAIMIPGGQAGQLTTVQPEAAQQRLSPQQQSAVIAELSKTGGVLTPEAVEALKSRPEFKTISPEEIAKGKELLGRKQKGAADKKGDARTTDETEKTKIAETARRPSLFDRYRSTGKYQDISTDLKPFGYDFFNDVSVTVMTERKDIPVPEDYVVGPGDEVRILMWGRISGQHDLVIDRSGNITIPQIGPIHVGGMTFQQMAGYLIKQSSQMVGANIDITMGTLKSIPVFVLGDVERPGAYTVGSFATITDALIIAGGPSEIGSMRNVQVRRKDKVVTTFDLYDLMIKGDKSKDRILQAGDVVFVPVVGAIAAVAGNVRRPAIYELKDKADLATLFDLAGGIIPTGNTQQIQVERFIKNERQVVVDLNDRDLARKGTIGLHDGDLVKVFNIVDKDTNAVYLEGNVKHSGKYEYRPGMRIRDLVKDSNELLKDTYLEYALVKRLAPPDLRSQLIPFNLGKLLSEGDKAEDIQLKPRDTVFVFSKWFFRDRPFVAVEGEVRKAKTESAEDFADAEASYAKPFAGDFPSRIKTARAAGPEKQLAPEERGKVTGVQIEEINRLQGLKLEEADIARERQKSEKSDAAEGDRGIRVDLAENMTIRDAITAAGGLTRDAYLQEAELYRTDPKSQIVTLRRFDLAKAIEGDPTANILLIDQDRLVIHSMRSYEYRKTVAIDGAVLHPGAYPYAEKMTIKDLVFAAGNVLESAFLDNAEVSSQEIVQDDQTVKIIHRTVSLKRALEGSPSENITLRPYDRLFVKRLSGWGKERFANIMGEVKFPGRYVLRDGERVSDLIERAGGYKDSAYLRGAVFTRPSVQELQQKNLEEMAKRLQRELLAQGSSVSSISAEGLEARKIEIQQKQAFVESIKGLKATGRMTVRLAHLRLLKGSEFDIQLEDGDAVFIPMNNQVVNIMGAVMSDSSVIYVDKASPKDYIRAAGGYTRYADAGNAYVLKVDGSARKLSGGGGLNWSDSKDRWEMAGFGEEKRQIEPGDTIVVPEKLERTAWLRDIKDITQILSNVAVAAGAVYLFGK